MQRTLITALTLAAAIGISAQPIDRKAVLERNNPLLNNVDTLGSFTLGNGRFAATVDITGLQSFPEAYKNGIPMCTMSEWGWHTFPNTEGLKPEESRRTLNLHVRESEYAVEYKDGSRGQDATAYYRANPHRLNLGTVGLQLPDICIDSIKDIDQKLDLWSGELTSHFSAGGHPYTVYTLCDPEKDRLCTSINSDAINGDTGTWVKINFPYPTGQHSDDASSAVPTDKASTRLIYNKEYCVIAERKIGSTTYYAMIHANTPIRASFTKKGDIKITCEGPIELSVEYSLTRPQLKILPYDYKVDKKVTAEAWAEYWRSGGFVDFGACTDPRAAELERRTVLSQYLTKVNCAGTMPPQETGLTYNTWFGRPHLEMTWWHGIDHCLWGHPEVLVDYMEWYDTAAYPEAKALAERQGFDGVRWMKMTDPKAGEAPSNVGSFLTWQQPHYIYFAEELYRHNLSDSILAKYGKYVEETAAFMADFAKACITEEGQIKLKGQTAMQESMSKDISYNHPFEQAYWVYGLKTAQLWRERQGEPRNTEWDDIINRIAPLEANKDGIYTAGDRLPQATISNEDYALKSRSDHPAVLGTCGLLPDEGLYDRETMQRTLDWVLENWNWETTWGWDYGMVAMAAARLGRPQQAIEALLADRGKNTYLVNGHNFQEPKRLRLYLPGNGALLDAVAMMCAGWRGSEGSNPGFPSEGWEVKWEGLIPMQ